VTPNDAQKRVLAAAEKENVVDTQQMPTVKSGKSGMTAKDVTDERVQKIARHRRVLASGQRFDMVSEDVSLGDGQVVRREYLQHPGAVAVIVLNTKGQVLLQRQYRHPVRSALWEPPAGLLDVAGEVPLAAARRELAEEAGLRAGDWRHLLVYCTSPGSTSERIRVYVARQLTEVPASERFERTEEEAAMPAVWLPLEEAADLVLSGKLTSPTAVVGILAAARAAARPGGIESLEPAYE